VTIALISDIHGNLSALDAVLNHIASEKITTIYCLGDIVGYGPEPSACLKRVSDTCDIILMGNHEYHVLGLVNEQTLNPVARQSAEWTRAQLGDTDLALISDLDMDAHLAEIYLVHASPHTPDQWRYIISTNEAELAFDHFDEHICFYGHSHLPMIFSKSSEGGVRQQIGHDFDLDREKRYLVNVGSVGQPRDNDSRAAYVTFNTDTGDITYHRVDYDIERTQQLMRKAGLPALLTDRLAVGQ
jgi:predicted phosphodiesterase